MRKQDNNIIYGRLVRSYLSSVVSISLVLFLVGLVGLLMVNAKSVSDYFKENIRMSAILKLEADDGDAVALSKQISAFDFVKDVDIITKEQGVKEMERVLGEDFLDVFESNPIPISLEIQIDAEYVSKDSLAVIEKKISGYPLVNEVAYQESLVDLLNANLEKIGIVVAVFIAILLFISFVLINNTVRLNVYSKRFTIHTMRLVGATKGFITGPFVGQAFFQGFISGSLAVLGLLGVLYAIRNEFNHLFMLFDLITLAYLLCVVIAIGVLICMASTSMVVRRLISLTKDDLYF